MRLTHNEAQGGWVLLAPERVFKADAIAVEILKRCTGEATLDAIVDDLAGTFRAPRERIQADVVKLLGSSPTRNCWSFAWPCARPARLHQRRSACLPN